MYTDNSAGRRIFKFAAKILIAFMLAATKTGPLSAMTLVDLTLAYEASFNDGSLEPTVDLLGLGQLKLGDSQTAATNPAWTLQDGNLQLGISQPVGVSSIVSAGAFATPVNFGTGSIFGLRATFLAPMGPQSTGNVWAVVLGARTGDEADLFNLTRAAATLQVRGGGIRLNSPGSAVPAGLPNLPQNIYDAIFDPFDPEPFVLELLVDRIAGAGNATLRVGSSVYSHDFQFAAFKPDSGPAITAIGPSLAISSAPGQSASVRVLDFQVFGPASAIPEPAAWITMILGFGLVGGMMRRDYRVSARRRTALL